MKIDFNGIQRNTGEVQPPLTSLIDMVFMLLIYFLLTMGFIKQEGIGISLPKATHVSQTVPEEIMVTIAAEEALFWNGKKINLTELKTCLQNTAGLRPETRIIIRADRSARVNIVVRVMDLAKSVGAANFCLATEKESI